MVQVVWPSTGGVSQLPPTRKGTQIIDVDVPEIPGHSGVVPRGGSGVNVVVVDLSLLGGAHFKAFWEVWRLVELVA